MWRFGGGTEFSHLRSCQGSRATDYPGPRRGTAQKENLLPILPTCGTPGAGSRDRAWLLPGRGGDSRGQGDSAGSSRSLRPVTVWLLELCPFLGTLSSQGGARPFHEQLQEVVPSFSSYTAADIDPAVHATLLLLKMTAAESPPSFRPSEDPLSFLTYPQ